MTDLVLVLTTMPDDDAADRLALTLVDERLAACVNVGPAMRSTYRWQGQVEQERERQLVIKTRRALVDRLRERLTALHPYELPEFLVLAIAGGSDAYLNWVAAGTEPPDA